MDWNLNTPLEWDWENLAAYGCKLQFPNHETGGNMVVDNGDNFSFLSSVDSSCRGGVKTFEMINNFHKDSVPREGFSTSEAMIGLKLGTQSYSQDASASSSSNFQTNATTFSLLSSSSPIIKRSRTSYLNSQQSPRCQVEGCNIDLSSAKDYHRRHRICANHSKSPKVVVAGMERRFCQQCSRFHDLSEFDDRKRSCRRRLSAHNARRRRPQPDEIQFSSTRILPSSICDRRPQMNFLVNKAAFEFPALNSALPKSSRDIKMTLGEESLLSLAKGVMQTNGAQHLDPNASCFHCVTPRSLNYNACTGVEANSNSIFAAEVRHAFSLLSTTTSSWSLNWPEEASSLDHIPQGNSISFPQPRMPFELQNTSGGPTQLHDFHSLKPFHDFSCFYSS